MLKYIGHIVFCLAFVLTAHAQSGLPMWEEGKHYFLVEPPQATTSGNKVEVAEVFSYGCPACNMFTATMSKIKTSLPANASINYIPASFRADEDWPLFQRAFFTAQALGILEKSHDAMFKAIWGAEGPLKIHDAQNKPLHPTLEAVAQFYAQYGVKPEDFIATANSFAINTQMKRADAMIKAAAVESTPTLIINGKYRLNTQTAGGPDKIIPLVQYLVQKETVTK